MAVIVYLAGSSQDSFNPSIDTVTFPAGVSAAQMTLSGVGSDLRVGYATHYMTLMGVSLAQLGNTTFSFTDGSVFRNGTIGADSLTGSNFADQILISAGGSDTV